MIYILRIIILGLYLGLTGLMGIIISLLRPFNPSNPYAFARLLTIFGFKLGGCKFKIKNKSGLIKHKPCLYISNHQSLFDVITCGAMVTPRTVSVGKKSLRWIPFFGQFYWLSGNILIDRSNKKKALKSMDVVTKSLREKNISVWIFPEGTRSKGQGLLKFKKGAFYTAINAQVQIVPIVISSYDKFLDLRKLNAGNIVAEVLDPIETKGKTLEDINDLLNECYLKMNDCFNKLNDELAKKERPL
ncbi:MAG: 1-acyl-sn-glycerol-3-phosphate acyltransferase [Epsilonproteobacteria bacterium]|nr:MAG: 1-acyl-sn-glycerol-3-phosphate acyltransferase [Campylobacterota bacterium]RLA65506.1 MAG: 1-acyl-sn-glycerol-3-phosphate acyltransferase [Campylobacterota bacterium]